MHGCTATVVAYSAAGFLLFVTSGDWRMYLFIIFLSDSLFLERECSNAMMEFHFTTCVLLHVFCLRFLGALGDDLAYFDESFYIEAEWSYQATLDNGLAKFQENVVPYFSM